MKRHGIYLLEMSVAGVLLLAMMAICVRYFAVTLTQRRALDQRQAAIVEAGNVMERVSAMPWTDLMPETMAAITLSADAKLALASGELKIDVAEEGRKPQAKRITVSVRWQDDDGQWVLPLRLAAWRYKL
jgi:hypothetical protein